MGEYEVIVVGGGHNGLIVAAYLLKAGVSVCVIERNEQVGGSVVTKELNMPGFKHDYHSTAHIMILGNPLIRNDELQLQSKYGLKYIYPDPSVGIVFPDDRSLVFYRDLDKTCRSIEQFSKRDAEAYRKLFEYCLPSLEMKLSGMFSPPPPFGKMIETLDQTEEGREELTVLLKSTVDVLDEWFESEEVKMAIIRVVAEYFLPPLESGTGNVVYAFVPFLHTLGLGIPRGGAGGLCEALERCIKDQGGSIRTSSTVKSIKVEGGKAKGVILESGEEVNANRAVVSNLNPKQLFLQMLKNGDLPSNFQKKVRGIRHSLFSGLNIHLSLNEPPKYKAGDEIGNTYMVLFTQLFEKYMRQIEECRFGITNRSTPLFACPTLFDSTRTPEGKHTLYIFQFQPFQLKGGANLWDKIKEEVANGIIQTLQDHTTNMGDENILEKDINSPLDIERYNPAMLNGDFFHIGVVLHQTGAFRPLPGWGNYTTPIENLYMCGVGTHPGGGVDGGGRAAVQAIMEGLGVDFKKVIGY